MSIANRIDEQAYLEMAADDDDRFLELWDGVPTAKPGMSWEHNDLSFELGHDLRLQLDPSVYRVRVNSARVRKPTASYFIPDVAVVPIALGRHLQGMPGVLEVYEAPLPLVVEIWSKSTGEYDITTKLAAYRARDDAEIWRLHPYRRTLTRWVRQAGGGYVEEEIRGGLVALAALPDVVVDLDALFAR